MKLVRLPKVYSDLVELGDYFGRDDLLVADRFFDAFELSLERIRKKDRKSEKAFRRIDRSNVVRKRF